MARAITLAAALGLIVVPGVASSVTLQFASSGSLGGHATPEPLAAATTTAGTGTCTSTWKGQVPATISPARASAALTEPPRCPTRTVLAFLPAVQFTDRWTAPASHTVTVQVDVVAVGGSTTILRNVQLYVQEVGNGNPIVTGTHALVRNGAVARMSSSSTPISPGSTYGLGIRVVLNLPVLPATATLSVILLFVLHDGGVARVGISELVALALTY